jgi:hypothetical protein
MYCRTCSKEVNDKAIACPGCGMAPLQGDNHCQDCGVATKPLQIMCIHCGVQLRKHNNFLSNSSEVAKVDGMGTGEAIFWFLCCVPIGFIKLNQGLKGLIWILISFLTIIGFVPMAIDYFMCNAKANKVGQLGEFEFFPRY